MMHPELLSNKIIWESVIPLLLVSIFVLVGISMIVFPTLRKKKLEKICIIPIFATIVDHDISYSDNGNKLYAPIYEYEYGKTTYKVCTNVYSNIGVKDVGTVEELKINPNNPEEFLTNSNPSKILIIMGVLFLLFSVPVLVFMLKTMEFFR